MISKELLTALVFVSLTQGSAFAQEITPGTYTDFVDVINTDKTPVIQAPGEYVFHGGLHIDNEFGSTQSHTAVISNGTGSGNGMTITADSGDNKGTLHISSNSDETPGNWQGTKNDIIRINSSNVTDINLTNTDLILDGENYDTAIRMDESKNTAQLTIQGDGNSDLLISGGMIGGIDAWYNAAVTIKDIDTFCISKNTKLDTTQIGAGNINAIRANTNSMVTINANDFSITGDKDDKDKVVFYAGISSSLPTSSSKVEIDVKNQFNIDSVYYGIYNASYVDIAAGDINIYAKALFNDEEDYYSLGEAVYSDGYLCLHAVNNINLVSELSGLDLGTRGVMYAGTPLAGQYIDIKGKAEVIAETGALNITGKKSVGVISLIQNKQDDIRDVLLQANGAINIYGGDKGIFYEPGSRQMDIISNNNDINITSENIAFYAADELRKEDIGRNPSVKKDYTRGIVNIKALEGGVNLVADNDALVVDNIAVKNSDKEAGGYFTTMYIEAGKQINIKGKNGFGIQASNILSNKELTAGEVEDGNTHLTINSQGEINIFGGKSGIMATSDKEEFNDASWKELINKEYGSNVDLEADDNISVQGGGYGISAFEQSNINVVSHNGNVLISKSDNGAKESGDNTAAVYVENGANTEAAVTLTSDNGAVTVLSDDRGLWASGKGGTINVKGAVNINADYLHREAAEKSSGDVHLAVVAGSKSEKEANNGTGEVNISLTGDAASTIYGDLVGARNGSIDIHRESGNGVLNVSGNVLAGNGGKVALDLGTNGILTGRIDDYMDADDEHTNFFAPEFSHEIVKSGQVDLTLGDGSRWNVDGQSWVTSVNVGKGTVIDLTGARTDRNTSAHALTIGTLKGDANFRMNLDGFDRANSDMLYIKNSDGEFNVILDDVVTTAEIGETGLRFATIDNDRVNFKNVVAYNKGAFDVKYKVGKDEYVDNPENDEYNGGDKFDAVKPGSDSVDDFFEVESTESLGREEHNVTNYKIITVESKKINDIGKTILDMSRLNYSNAIYMDRLNKRLGEARYIDDEEDQGMWVRIRHDRIGKEDAFRSRNTMYELGYDEKRECDNGTRRTGLAIDYMNGDTDYSAIGGSGEIERYGLWLYDTWLGDKGHYTDYVAKWGHLKNDFDIWKTGIGDKVEGDYSNNVFSISAEYGRKKDIGNDWYFEPQAQVQLAHVTGADYMTSYGDTRVNVSGINSLIGRAGFRIGKDTSSDTTIYAKADILHEFLGDQDISLNDDTTNNSWEKISYENRGTWYDVGFGFATKMSESSYIYMDFEKSFGNDNDDTYQISAGIQWSF